MIGVALRIAASRISSPGREAWASARASAWRRIRSARFCLPPFISLAENRAVIRLAGIVSYFAFLGMLVRRGNLRAPGLVVAFAPYLFQPRFRSRTPAASSVPRMMWYLTDG